MSEELNTFSLIQPGVVAIGFSFPIDRPPTAPTGGDAARQRMAQVSIGIENLGTTQLVLNAVQVQFPSSYRPASNFFDADFTLEVASGAQTPSIYNAEQKISGTPLQTVTIGSGGEAMIGPFSVTGDIYLIGSSTSGTGRIKIAVFERNPIVVAWKDPEQASGDTRARSYVSPFSITTVTLVGGVHGVAYSKTVASDNGSGSVSYAVTSGALPGGLSLASGTGVISGTPSAAGTSTFTVTATDGAGNTAAQTYTVTFT